MMSQESLTVSGGAAHLHAASAIAGLLGRLRIDAAFVGAVASSAWLGEPVSDDSIDVVALVSPERMQQIPMMAANNGFVVDAEAVESARELDLIPMARVEGDAPIRVHVLIATTAIYTKMIRDAVEARMGDETIRVIRAEDLLLLQVVDDREVARDRSDRLVERMGREFDSAEFNRRLVAIGLGSKVIQR